MAGIKNKYFFRQILALSLLVANFALLNGFILSKTNTAQAATVAFDAVGPSSAGTSVANGSSLSWTHTNTGTNLLLTVGVAIGKTNDVGLSLGVTYNGAGMTSTGKVHSGNDVLGFVEMFYLKAPATGVHTIQVTLSGGTAAMEGGSVSFTGVDQTTPVKNIITNVGSSTNATVNVSSATGDMVVSAAVTGCSFTSSGQTSRWVNNQNCATGGGNGAQSTANGSSSVTLNYTVSNDLWGIVAMDVAAASGGGTDTTPPTVSISSPVVGSTLSGTTTVTASASDNVGVAGVQFQLDGTNLGTEDTTVPYSVSFNTTMASNGVHTLTAVARDTSNNTTTSSLVSVTFSNVADTTPPSTPTSLSATVISSSQINLAWTASTDNVGVTGYKIYRGGVQIGTTASTAYSDTGLSASTTYSYTVSATDGAGNNSSQSSSASATTQAAGSTYEIPSDRTIQWAAGSDQWNGGVLPTRSANQVNCTMTAEGDGTTNNATAITSCLSSTPADGVAIIPPGIYYVNSVITIPANKTLRGSGMSNCVQGNTPSPNPAWSLSTAFHGDTGGGAACTTLKMGTGGRIPLGGAKPTLGAEVRLLSGYTKDSTTITTSAAHGLAVGNWISLFEDGITGVSDGKGCSWCGEDSGGNLVQQFAQVTSVPSSTTFTMSRPLYLTFTSDQNPGLKKVTWASQKAGLESMKVWGFGDSANTPLITSQGCLECWAKSIETYNSHSGSEGSHINLEFSHANEVRDSFFHDGRDHGSGSDYGIHIMFWNSDHKIENNIFSQNRHAINFEGGGSGVAVLYNYIENGWESEDSSYLSGDLNPNHGAHPFMDLMEGNDSAKITWDYTWGSSSNNTAFRNHVRGTRASPSYSWGVWAFDLQTRNRYMNLVGNLVGMPSWTTGTVMANGNCEPYSNPTPVAFRFGCSGEPGSYTDSQVRSTAILHGNYDYITDGVAAWDGGANHTLKASMYYTSKPAFFGSCAWPAFGPDVMLNTIPAKELYNRSTACAGGGGGDTQAPTIPSGLNATAISSSQINLSWSASSDNVGVTGYRVYRGGSQIGTSGSTSYSDIGLTASTAYSYTVAAYDGVGNTSSQSTSASATTQGSVTPVIGDINLDHVVNSVDYSILNSKWFTTDASSDLNHDGIVNAIDYSMLNANWLKTW